MIVNKYFNGGGGGSGERGPQGPQGPEGPQGPQGANGQDGLDGKDGADGKDGLDGQTGPQGVEGAQGPQGVEGQVGPQGPQGPQGENGINQDPTLLKSSSGTPENVGAGDVFATHEDPEAMVIGSTWTDSGEQNIQYDRDGNGNPQAVRIAVGQNDTINLSWAIEPWDTSDTFSVVDGAIYSNNDWYSGNGTSELRFKEENWLSITDGKSVRIAFDDGYIYFYTEDPSKIWIYGVSENYTGNNVYEGEVIPPHDDIDNLYQVKRTSVTTDFIEVSGEGDYEDNRDTEDQFIIHNGGSMVLTLVDKTIFGDTDFEVCAAESWGSYAPLVYAPVSDAWTLYDYNETLGGEPVGKIGDGESDTIYLGGDQIDWSYSGNVLTIKMYTDKGWQHWNIPSATNNVLIPERVAKASELPTKVQLVPKFDKYDQNDMALVVSQYNSDGLAWTSFGDITFGGLRNFENFYDVEEGALLVKRDNWGLKWENPEPPTRIEAVSALPSTTKDGNVVAYANASGYGISQAQSGVTILGWVQPSDECETGYTQIRVPYTAESTTFQGFKFDDGQGGESEGHNLWWHYDGGNNPYWQGDNVPIDEQVDGEFSGTDPWGVSISSVRSGDYLVVTFGTGVTSTEKIEDTERYANYVAPNYANVVTSESIAKIWRGTQADYNALSPNYDNNTFYIIL